MSLRICGWLFRNLWIQIGLSSFIRVVFRVIVVGWWGGGWVGRLSFMLVLVGLGAISVGS